MTNPVATARNADERGTTLVELLVGLAIAAVLLGSMTKMLASATAASNVNAVQLDLQTQAQFAVRRIAIQLGQIPNTSLPPKADDKTSAAWNLSTSYIWDSTAGTLSETVGSGPAAITRVIADSVSNFSITTPVTASAQTVISVNLTLTRGLATAFAGQLICMGNLL